MSYTETQAGSLRQAQQEVFKLTSMTRDEYSELMFAHGTAFALHYCRQWTNQHDMSEALLANQSYWQWWILKYALEDQALISDDGFAVNMVNSAGEIYTPPYEELKAAMIGDSLLERELDNMIKKIL